MALPAHVGGADLFYRIKKNRLAVFQSDGFFFVKLVLPARRVGGLQPQEIAQGIFDLSKMCFGETGMALPAHVGGADLFYRIKKNRLAVFSVRRFFFVKLVLPARRVGGGKVNPKQEFRLAEIQARHCSSSKLVRL